VRTDTVTFCGGWNILAHFGERSNSEEQNLSTDGRGLAGFELAFYRGPTRIAEIYVSSYFFKNEMADGF
jgi:hypothetical protein